MRRDMRRPTSAKRSASSAVWNRRSTSLRWICRIATPASWWPIRRRRRKPSATATSGPSHSSAACRSRFSTITPGSRWPASSVTASGSARGCSASCNRTICSKTGSAGLAKATTRACPGPRSGGKVEGLVGHARRNFLVPIPVFESFAALNAHLLECCRRRMADCLRGHDGTIGERLERDLAAFQTPLPAPYDACEKVPTSVSSLSLVRYRCNDYSVPTTYGHRDVLVRGYVHDVVISCGAEVIARHPRSYEREDFVFDPLHYLALIEQKINALDQAAPLTGWQLPEEFATLRRLLEARIGKQGKREFVQVLRLMEVFRADEVAAAVGDAIARRAIGFDAVKHLVLCRIERRPPRLDMTVYPYLPQAHVAMTSAKTYLGLLTGAAS